MRNSHVSLTRASFSYLEVLSQATSFGCFIEDKRNCSPFLRALHISSRALRSRVDVRARDRRQFVRSYYFTGHSRQMHFFAFDTRVSRASHSPLTLSLSSPDRAICHGCISAIADHSETSRYIHLTRPPSSIPHRSLARKFILYSSCQSVLLFARGEVRRRLSWDQFIWDYLTDRPTWKIATRILFLGPA